MSDSSLQPMNTTVMPATQTMQYTPDDIFKKIDEVRAGLRNEIEPTVLAQIFVPSARRRAEMLNAAKTSAIHARRELIEGLADCIKIYIDVHKGDLKVRGDAFVTATFATMIQDLNRVMESTYISFLETYSVSFERIGAIPNLTDEQVEKQRQAAYARADKAAAHGEQTFNDLLDELTNQVKKVLNEIGS